MPKELENKFFSFFYNVFTFQLFCICYRFKYYFIWEITSLCFYLIGLDLANIDFLKVESALSLREVSKEWNSWGGTWLKECFFDRIDFLFLGGITTFLVAALWHGAHLHDFSFFISYCFVMQLTDFFHSFLPKNSFFKILSIIETNLLISYVPLHFYYSNIKEGNAMLKRMYYYGHFYFLFLLLFFIFMNIFGKKVKKEKLPESFKKIK